MRKRRRSSSSTEKLAILREHLIERVAILEVCDKHGLQPTVFYQRQRKLFEEGAAVFDRLPRKSSRRQAAEARRIAALEASENHGGVRPRGTSPRKVAATNGTAVCFGPCRRIARTAPEQILVRR